MILNRIAAIKTPKKNSPLGESVLKLNHYKNGINQGVVARELLIEDLTPNDDVKIICGELSHNTFLFIKKVLKKGASLEVIFGNENITSREDVDKLLEKYPNFTYTQLKFRPKYHGALIGKNMYLESKHHNGEQYETFLLIKNAWNETINDFKDIFNRYSNTSNVID
jgi:hypothetical protein